MKLEWLAGLRSGTTGYSDEARQRTLAEDQVKKDLAKQKRDAKKEAQAAETANITSNDSAIATNGTTQVPDEPESEPTVDMTSFEDQDATDLVNFENKLQNLKIPFEQDDVEFYFS